MFCEKYVLPGMDDVCIGALEASTVLPVLTSEDIEVARQVARRAGAYLIEVCSLGKFYSYVNLRRCQISLI